MAAAALKKAKSAGADNIPAELFQAGGYIEYPTSFISILCINF